MSDEVCRVWLRRARSNLTRAELGRQQEISCTRTSVLMPNRRQRRP